MKRDIHPRVRSTMTRLLAVTVMLLVGSCSEQDGPLEPPPESGSGGVYILNEGNFNRGNASVSYYLPDSNRVYNAVFEAVNRRRLGDTGNSLALRGGKAYIVVNGSNKVEIIDIKTQKSDATIQCPAGSSPRHIAFASDTKAYVTNLYDNSVSIVDLATESVVGRVPTGNNPEEMLLHGGHLYVVNSGFGTGRSITVIDVTTDEVSGSLPVGDGPIHIRHWRGDTAVVLCQGDFGDFNDPMDDTPGWLYFIDLSGRRVTDSLLLGGHPFEVTIDAAGRMYTLYAGEGVRRIDLAGRIVSNTSFISGNFYTLAADTRRGWLYVTDPKDYLQPGTVSIYDLQGGKIRSFTAGINPGWIELVP